LPSYLDFFLILRMESGIERMPFSVVEFLDSTMSLSLRESYFLAPIASLSFLTASE
jgi:hypothetical protein